MGEEVGTLTMSDAFTVSMGAVRSFDLAAP